MSQTSESQAQGQPVQRVVYGGYKGKPNPTERDRIVHLLDVYRSTEGFVAQYLPKWIDVSPSEAVKGGLRTVQAREAAHARLMKARLMELGERAEAEVSEERRQKEIPFFSSAQISDREKLQILKLFVSAHEFARPYAAPPDIPVDRATALITAFEATTKDPAFLAETAQHQMEVAPVSGKKLAEMLSELYRTPEPILAKARIAIAR